VIGRKVKVLIVDDSAVARQVLKEGFAEDPGIEVVGTAPDPFVARDKILRLNPDVLTLDVEMDRMDGLTFLEKLMASRPMPVVILSALTATGCETAIRALQLGAVDVLQKPSLDVSGKLNEMMDILVERVKVAAASKVGVRRPAIVRAPGVGAPPHRPLLRTTEKVVVIGASTGGTEALRTVLSRLPADFPGTLIAQHMPENFTRSFADSLGKICRMEVREAAHGDAVHAGLVLVARGNHHMVLKRSGARYFVELNSGPLVCRQRPSVGVLFDSAAEAAGKNAVGVILTGMGNDGAEGLLRLRQTGAFTIAQDEKTSVVYGMPCEAFKLGAAVKVSALDDIPAELIDYFSKDESAG
jgi:two-component system chemotaxis response regulator CheB